MSCNNILKSLIYILENPNKFILINYKKIVELLISKLDKKHCNKLLLCSIKNNNMDMDICKLLITNDTIKYSKDILSDIYNKILIEEIYYDNNILKYILKNINVNYKDENNKTLLIKICENKITQSMMNFVKILLSIDNIDVNNLDNKKWSALMYAVKNSKKNKSDPIIKLLCNHPDINVNIQGKNKWTPFMIACKYSNKTSNLNTVKILLKTNNIDINMINSNKWSALMFVCRNINGDSSSKTLELLLKEKSLEINNNILSPIMLLLNNYKDLDNKKLVLELLIKLSKDNINIDKIDKNGDNILLLACKNIFTWEDIDKKIVKKILEIDSIKENINIINKKDESALKIAYMNMNSGLIEMLEQEPNITKIQKNVKKAQLSIF
jgi:ankyrin repeat protein